MRHLLLRSRLGLRSLGFALLLMLATLPSAAVDFGYQGIEVRGGVILPDDWDTGYTAGVLVNLGELFDNFYFLTGGFYGQTEDSVSLGPGQSFDQTIDLTYFALGAEIRYFFNSPESGFYVGGGPYLHLLDYEFATQIGPIRVTSETDSTSIGLVGVGGYRLTRNLAIEARYNTVSIARGPQLLASISF